MVAICKEVAMPREIVSRSSHERGDMGVGWSSVGVLSLVQARWVPVSGSSVEVLVSGNVSNSGTMANTISTGSFGLRFWNFSCPFLVCLGFLHLENSFLEGIHRILLLKIMILDAFNHSLQCIQFLLIYIILEYKKNITL